MANNENRGMRQVKRLRGMPCKAAPALRRSSGTLGRGDSTRGAVSAIGAVSANRTVQDATRIVKKLTFFLSSN